MKTKVAYQITKSLGLLLLLSTINYPPSTFGQGSAFTYQGRLNASGQPANGLYDLRFRLSSDVLGNNYIGSPLLLNSQSISNGLFTAALDFGQGAFTGTNLWLEVDVRTNGGGGYTTLNPLQSLTPAPYAIMAATASNISGTLPATQLTGALPSAQLSGTYSSAVTFNNAADSFSGAFTGNGAAVTNVNAATLGGSNSASFWKIGGNAGTTAGANFMGTADNQPLEFRVNGTRALRLEPNTNGAPNVIGGAPNNFVAPGIVGATIGGGGAANYGGVAYSNKVSGLFATVGGGNANTSSGDNATVAGGTVNTAGKTMSTVGGGYHNLSSGQSATVAGGYDNISSGGLATVGGGYLNTSSGSYSAIAGGLQNVSSGNAAIVGGGYANTNSGWYATVGGGWQNSNSGDYATVGGGLQNISSGLAATIAGGGANASDNRYATVGGGSWNISSGVNSTVAGGNFNTNASDFGTLSGGRSNLLQSASADNTISGGNANVIQSPALSDTIAGGVFHLIETTAINSTIGGGFQNKILAGANDATVAGGGANISGGLAATIGGGGANTSTNDFATVPGGAGNIAGGQFSFAAGHDSRALHDGTFVWADSPAGGFASTGSNQFCLRARGGIQLDPSTSQFFGSQFRQMLNLYSTNYGLGVQNDSAYFRCASNTGNSGFLWYKGGVHSDTYADAGGGTELMHLIDGGLYVHGTFNNTSDRNAKQDFAAVDCQRVLDKVAQLPIQTWAYKADPNIKHLGPVAQDFHSAFGIGPDDKHIATVDESGVALAAIQGLNQKLEQKETKITELEQRLEKLERLMSGE